MRTRTRVATAAGVTVAGLAAATGVAVATGAIAGDDENELRHPGTITVDESTLPEKDAAEHEALAEVATVDEADAARAAVGAVGDGEVTESELEAEDGYVVWEVTVRAADGSLQEVTVDAGDTTVLGTEAEEDESETDGKDSDDGADESDDEDDSAESEDERDDTDD